MNIKGYLLIAQLEENKNSVVYRASRETDQTPVVIKILKKEFPSQKEIYRYKQEYEITSSHNLNGVIRSYDFLKCNNMLLIVFEDFGGESLKKLYDSRTFTLNDTLLISCKIVDCLLEIHRANIIHKDINPSNIVYNLDTKQLKLIDFGVSTILTREETDLYTPAQIEGTFAYMSPEQTGRVNRPLDYRTDFYSLGVTLYELFCRKLPFPSEDRLNTIYCHIAKESIPPYIVNSKIPRQASDVIMKLLSKAPEDRYHTAYGIKRDLEMCLKLLSGASLSFHIGSYDLPDKLHISQKLYGREREVDFLMRRFESVSQGGREMALVAGYSGIGKTSLVKEIYSPITKRRGYFTSGKFDQYMKNIPCSAIVSAFRELIRQILAETDEQLQQWRTAFINGLGKNGQIIIDVIPELELIINKQPPVPELPPVEAQNRFYEVFKQFLAQFCTAKHPLVVFIDDLQWVDNASLKLIEQCMLDERILFFFFVGAYRDNEVSQTHPLIFTINSLKKDSKALVNQIDLPPLNLSHIALLIENTFYCDNARAVALASLVNIKTAGNPFFINQFLKTLYSEKLITFVTAWTEENTIGWRWSLPLIEKANITDNVVDLMIEKLKKLPLPTIDILKMAACIGNRFDLKTISIIVNQSLIETFNQLKPALNEELILSLSGFELTEDDILAADIVIINFKFLHDRVQQAAYSLIQPRERDAMHLMIGQRLYQEFSTDEIEQKIFAIVDHLNRGREFITNQDEIIRLAKMNLKASLKAKESTAYVAALSYIQAGMDLLPKTLWETHYELALNLYRERAVIEYLNAHDSVSETFILEAVDKVKTNIEKAQLLHILIVQYTMRAQYQEAIQTARKALLLVGVDIPNDDEDLIKARDVEMDRVRINMGNKTIASLIHLPQMKREEKIIAMKLLTSMGPPCYRTHHKLWAIIVSKQMNLCLEFGDVSSATYTYTSYGGLTGYVYNDFKSAAQYAHLTEVLCQKYHNPSDTSVAYLMIGSSLRPWFQRLKYAEQDYYEAYKVGLESGNLQYSGYAFGHNAYCMFYQGKSLAALEKELPELIKFSRVRQNQWAIDLISGVFLLVSFLQGKTDDKLLFNSDEEKLYLEQCERNKNMQVICVYYILKMQILFLFNYFTEAFETSKEVEKLLISVATQSLLPLAEYKFYLTLLLASRYGYVSGHEKLDYLKQMLTNQKQFKLWADNCPENFHHKYLLISAEIERIANNEMQAVELYEKAIDSAKENGFVQVEALATEMACKFWFYKGNNKIAVAYMKDTLYAYALWGATYKIENLKLRYAQLIEVIKESLSDGLMQQVMLHTSTSTKETMDLEAVTKSTQVISSEIQMDKLLAKMMRIILENAGAQRGHIILFNHEHLFIEAAASADSDQVGILCSMPLEQSNQLSVEIVRFVVRTGESVVIKNALKDERFLNDCYIQHNRPVSILATPIIYMKRIIGAVYLENNLITNAFSEFRIQILNILIPQMAISIENARLYENLKHVNKILEQRVKDEVVKNREKDYMLINQSKMASLGEMLVNISHHWRQPLNAINHIIFDIKDAYDFGELDAEYVNHSSQEAANQLRYLSKTIDDFRNLFKPSSEQETRDIWLVIREVIAMVEDHYQDLSISICFDYDANEPMLEENQSLKRAKLQITTHINDFKHAILNILHNAKDAIVAKQGKNELQKGVINIKLFQHNDKIVIQISDNGGGIPENIIDKIFEPYFTTKFKSQSAGVGLYMAKTIIETHLGGNLNVANANGGAIFTIEMSST
jgi:predicted ATPase/signal transduction histidine kinase